MSAPTTDFYDREKAGCVSSGMSLMDQIAGVLQNYAGGQPQAENAVGDHYDQVATAAPKEDLAAGLASAFRSDQTPPFGQMVSQLFGQSNNQQRAGLLNTLLSSGAGSGLLAQIAAAAGISLPTGGSAQVTPEDAGKLTPEAVQQAAEHAEKQDPSIVDRVSALYAEHPALFRTLGATALSLAMSHMANRRRS